MLVYDICGCEGTYTVESCSTIFDLIRTNLGTTSFKVSEKSVVLADVVSVLKCPDHTNASGAYAYSPESNFIDILGVLDQFNFTKDISKTTQDISSATSRLVVQDQLSSSKSNLTIAKQFILKIDVAQNYNFTVDQQNYTQLRTNLQANPAPYYATYSPAANAANIATLSRLMVRNQEMESQRDLLSTRKNEFNSRVDELITKIDEISRTINETKESITVASTSITSTVDYVLTVNRYTPCGFIGNAFENLIVGDFCENFYLTLDQTVPGSILCL
eukprot:1373229-Amorphochlora_amoeboformis.AAC.2